MRKNLYLFFVVLLVLSACTDKDGRTFGNKNATIKIVNSAKALWQYQTAKDKNTFEIAPPQFEVDGKIIICQLSDAKMASEPKKLRNNATEYIFEGTLKNNPDLILRMIFRVPESNPVIRFKYILQSNGSHVLTKSSKKDNLQYLATSFEKFDYQKEIRFSEFNEMVHSFTLSERNFGEKHFSDSTKLMGPMIMAFGKGKAFLLAYEHGSQVPDAFLQYNLNSKKDVQLVAVKGNYYDGQEISEKKPFQSIWFEIVAVNGTEKSLAQNYRSFVLHDMTNNLESRKPYIFYNTWNYQERMKHWYKKAYLDSMNVNRMLREIDAAAKIGIEVFVIDAGWFEKTGDWQPSLVRFPDSLKMVKKKLDGYGMKLGLWFNPTAAAKTSNMYQKLKNCVRTNNGKANDPWPVWETEASYGMCLVSKYRDAFADELIRISKEYGVSYFKWDAIDQYGCNDPGHMHGTDKNTINERQDCFAFEVSRSMQYIVEKLGEACPKAIVDFDITEGGRAVGLGFLAVGKYFLVNNGPYYFNYNIPFDMNKDNWNIFFYPGPARGWICRTPLNFDKWVPTVLFLTHYLPDDPIENQSIAIGSLILGQNGIWGDLPKISKEGVEYMSTMLKYYKQVRNDIIEATMITDGVVGGSPEVYEKINPETGKGVIVLFSSHKGSYSYISRNKPLANFYSSKQTEVTIDKNGFANIEANFETAEAKIIFFGVK